MTPPPRHRNITVKRLALDFYQFIRSQSLVVGWFGRQYNPSRNVRLELCTNYFGRNVHKVLEKLPGGMIVKSTLKTSRVNLFKPFNMAPVDTWFNRFSDYSCGCRIVSECGLGLTPSGYYMCAIAGGIDRIFQYHLGRECLPDQSDTMADQMSAFCRLCGHFGFQWPVRKEKISPSWQKAYLHFCDSSR